MYMLCLWFLYWAFCYFRSPLPRNFCILTNLDSFDRYKAGSLKMNTALEYSTRVVQEGGRWCKKSTLYDLVHLTPLRIPLMNPPIVYLCICWGFFPFKLPSVHFCMFPSSERGGRWTPMRLKARGLAQRGGPPGWLEESDPAGVILLCDGWFPSHFLC